jgi:hypothetical protein
MNIYQTVIFLTDCIFFPAGILPAGIPDTVPPLPPENSCFYGQKTPSGTGLYREPPLKIPSFCRKIPQKRYNSLIYRKNPK